MIIGPKSQLLPYVTNYDYKSLMLSMYRPNAESSLREYSDNETFLITFNVRLLVFAINACQNGCEIMTSI